MKKLFASLLILGMLAGISLGPVGCGDKDKKVTTKTETTKVETTKVEATKPAETAKPKAD